MSDDPVKRQLLLRSRQDKDVWSSPGLMEVHFAESKTLHKMMATGGLRECPVCHADTYADF
jgi:hypothetical protein